MLDKILECKSKMEIYSLCRDDILPIFLSKCPRLNLAFSENKFYWKDKFLTCPAASNPNFHGCYVGGLFIHSVLVTLLMFEKNKNEIIYSGLSKDSIIFTGMFHDLGKIGKIQTDLNEIEPYYLEKSNGWYELNRDLPFHHELSIFNLINLNLSISYDEFTAILHHNGPYLGEFDSYKGKESPLYLLLHMCDMEVSRIVEKEIQELKWK